MPVPVSIPAIGGSLTGNRSINFKKGFMLIIVIPYKCATPMQLNSSTVAKYINKKSRQRRD